MIKKLFIAKAEKRFGKDAYDYSLVPENISSLQNITIICPKHGEIVMRALRFLEHGCIHCFKEAKTEEAKQRFLKLAREKHGNDKFDYSEVEYVNSMTPVKIYCNVHKAFFLQTPHTHIRSNTGCPMCADEVRHRKKSPKVDITLTDEFIEKAKKIHGDAYGYDKVKYVNLETKVQIYCKKHKEYFWQSPSGHLSGEGCPLCANEKRQEFNKKRFNTETFIEKARKVHGDLYGYDEVEYVNSVTKVKIYCYKHQDYFWQTPSKHLSGDGCPLCSKEYKSAVSLKQMTDFFISRSKQIYGDDAYNYESVNYVDMNTKVKIFCNVHQEYFYVKPVTFLYGRGCPKCNKKITEEEFKQIARRIYGDIYNYDDIVFVDMKTKIKIFCTIHNEYFWQTPSAHIGNISYGCKKCENDYQTQMFIKRAKEIHGDSYGYDEVKYINDREKVKIFCNKHQEYFFQLPGVHLRGCGCPLCGNENMADNFRYTKEQFIEKAREVHGDLYGYDEVEYVNNNTKVKILCKKDNRYFWQTPGAHLNGQGCPYCSHKGKQSTITTEMFIQKAKEMYDDDRYGYDAVKYVNSHTKIKIFCKKHQKYFEIFPNDFLRGRGCPYCAGNKHMTKEEFIEKARKVHGDLYGYDDIEYVNATTKIKIFCKIHKEYFWQTPTNHLKGKGCPLCFGSLKISTEEFIERSKNIYGEYTYDYSKVEYLNMHTPVCIICPKHGEFWVTPSAHLFSNTGCPVCSSKTIDSKLSLKVKQLLNQNNIDYIEEYKDVWLKNVLYLSIDIFVPKYNIAIECHGAQHIIPIDFFGGQKSLEGIMNRDVIKNKLCKEHNIDILYCCEKNFAKLFENYELGYVYSDVNQMIEYIKSLDNERIGG